jgi:hypothetical protein
MPGILPRTIYNQYNALLHLDNGATRVTHENVVITEFFLLGKKMVGFGRNITRQVTAIPLNNSVKKKVLKNLFIACILIAKY